LEPLLQSGRRELSMAPVVPGAPRRTLLIGAGLLLATLCVAAFPTSRQIYLLAALDGVLSLLSPLLEDTGYAPGYSHAKFRTLRVGMTEAQVRATVGTPLDITWTYEHAQPALDGDRRLWFSATERVRSAMPREGRQYQNKTAAEMRQLVGAPDSIWWSYSMSPGSHSYRIREVEFRDGRVVRVRSELYID
jgi:hypothetical protein